MKRPGDAVFLVCMALFVPALPLFAGSPEEEPVDYPVRDIPLDSEKFEMIFRTVAEQELKSQLLPTKRFRITRRIEGNRYLANLEGKTIAVDMLGPRIYVDDTAVSAPLEDTGKIHTFIDPMGVKRTVKHLEEVAQPLPIDRGEFVKRLQLGGYFVIRKGVRKERCRDCGGFADSALRRTKCQACRGKGFFTHPLYLRVMW